MSVHILTRDVECPRCGAGPRKLCTRPDGSVFTTRSGHPRNHAARVIAAAQAQREANP